MLSILIPIYNFNIVDLAREIQYQADRSGVKYEILLVDDDSDFSFKKENRITGEWKHFRYEELAANIGRARIRNKMAGMARFPWLLFLDCDSRIVNPDYIMSYLARFEKEAVICGGRAYETFKPNDSARFLHWHYGRKREQKSARDRNRMPWNSFMTNNFAIARSIFEKVAFDDSIDKYGHEDTLFGFELKRRGIPVLHIDNPLVHIGLETNTEFLRKTKEGVGNLSFLVNLKSEYKNTMVKGIKLLRHYSWLQRFHLLVPFRCLYAGIKNQILANLMSRHPMLLLFDIYKLGLMAEYERT
jgi:cellulose synthase/poly-beta-1,6-N-acetylglucosamine synthase-like glycosyltransferase